MRIYYQDELVTLYHGDCLEIDAWTQADILITDPPYGIDGHLSAGWKGRKPKGWTRVNEKPEWDLSLDVRDAALEMWGDRPAAVFGSPKRLDNPPRFREVPLIWDKGTVGMGDVKFPWGPSYELIFVSGQGWHGKRESSILFMQHTSQAATRVGHPTPKPVGLMEQIIAKAPPGAVADPFAGGGATLIAARNLGRQAIGVEFQEKYCEITARRLTQAVLI